MSEELDPITESTPEEATTPPAEPTVPAPSAPPPAATRPAAVNVEPAPAVAASNGGGPGDFVPSIGGRQRRTSVDARLEDVNYKNVPLLSRFLDPRGRILSRRKTRVSAKVQRRVVQAIKHARHLALLPYTSDQTRIVRRRR